mmetsp:Transcript_6677/g.20205  ORF Transcript_6677/g.20205 Transcript_6677/m.20205 type:complete len:82 (+) Transcript_6677:1174-1419(+)
MLSRVKALDLRHEPSGGSFGAGTSSLTPSPWRKTRFASTMSTGLYGATWLCKDGTAVAVGSSRLDALDLSIARCRGGLELR